MTGETDQTGVCRLCHKHGTLRMSHIIPEFLYKPLYDSKHRLCRLSTGDKPARPYEQKGARERLLCPDCEGQFSTYERYARGVLYGGEPIRIEMDDPRRCDAMVDYRRFKLFELSLLWRLGVTSLPELKDAHLGCHERRIRRMLQVEDPGKTAEYGCLLIWPESHRQIFDETIMNMGMVKIQKVPCCRLIVAGMCWLFFLSRQAHDSHLEGVFLQDSGLLRIIRGDFGLNHYIVNLAHDLHKNNPGVFKAGTGRRTGDEPESTKGGSNE